MSLRWKLALGFGGLLLLIAGIGIHNIARITALGESIDVILRENYRSVVACQEMKEAIERMDSGAVFVLLGAEEKGNEQITRHEALFENALRAELANVTLLTEGEKAERLAELFRQYRTSIQAMRNPAIGREARRKTYFEELQPLFQRIKGSADEILRMNQQNMVDMDARARKQAESVRGQMYLMLLASTLLAGGFLFLTGKWILHPITRLTYSANEIRKGNLDLVVQSGSRDEVGQLSAAFNEMAASLREFRRTGEARLLRIQRSTQRAFDSLPEAIAVVNPEGEVEVATGTAQEAFGLRPKVRVSDLAFPWMPRLLEEALRKGRTVVPEGTEGLVQHFVQNEERFYRPKSVPILDSGGEAAGVVLILQDVTQQRRLDEKKSGVISTVSHQLKTPLTSIRMAIYLLLEEKVGGLSPKQADLLAAAGEDADRLARIVDELLDIGRIESGKARLEFRPVPPDDLVSRQVEAYRAAARDGGISLLVDLPGSLPKVWVDPARIAHVFSNLLSNALKHTPPGGKVTLTAKADGEYVRFQVSDTGVGIPERHLPRIFEQFFRVPEQGPGSGVGLGLAIVKDIVEAHGGSVGVESREGAGSTFFFTLRRADYTPVEGVRT